MSLEKIDRVWLVLYTKHSIEIVGVFSTLQKAVEICTDKFYVVGPFEVDKDYTAVTDWEDAFRPLGGALYPDKDCDCTDCEAGKCNNGA